MGEETSQENRQERLSQTDSDRIRSAARTLRKPRTALSLADETDVPVGTAQKCLDRLVEDSVLRKIEQDGQMLYCIDQLMAAYREVATLQREYDREELSIALESMKTRIADWKETYDVETPDKLRATTSALEDKDEIEQRHEIASKWEQLADRLSVVHIALTEYDYATEQNTPLSATHDFSRG